MVVYIDIPQEAPRRTRTPRQEQVTQEAVYIDMKPTLTPRQEQVTRVEEEAPTVPLVVQTYVKQQDRLVEQEVLRKQGVLLEFIRTQYNKLVTSLNTIPRMIIGTTLESSTSVSNTLYEYADALGGKNGDKDNDTDTLMIEKAHLEYIDKLRRSNIAAYKQALSFYDALVDQNLSRKQQGFVIAAYVTRELDSLKTIKEFKAFKTA